MLLTSAVAISPHVFAYFKAPQGYYFGGFNILTNLVDVQGVYFPAMRNFAAGDWLFRNQFNPGMKPIFLHAVYLVLGKIVAISNFPVWVVYVGAIFVLTIPFVFLVFAFLDKIFGNFKKELFAFGLVIFGGFIGATYPEVSGIFTLQFPHFIVSVFSLFLFLYNLYLLHEGSFPLHIILILVSSLLISITHPWLMVFLLAFTALWIFYLFLIKGYWARVALVFFTGLAVSVPFLLYYGGSQRIPWAGYVLPFGVGQLLLMFAPEVPFFIYGFLNRFRKYPFFAIWFAVQLFFVFLPIPFARRFLEGIYFPIAVFSFLGFSDIVERLTKGKHIFSYYLPAFCYLSLGTIVTFFWSFLWIPNPYVYKSLAEKEASGFLDTTASRHQEILTMAGSGNYLASEVSANLFVGHPLDTNEYTRKSTFAREFYSAKDASLWQEKLLYENICYIYNGPMEKKLRGQIEADYMQRIFSNSKVDIYKTSWCK